MLPFFKFGGPESCTYCGEFADQTDHVIAVASQVKLLHIVRGRKRRYGPITPCCAFCNRILHAHEFGSFLERCKFVAETYSDRTGPELWTEEEATSLGYTLRTLILERRNLIRWNQQKSNWFQSREFFLNLEELTYIPWLEERNPRFSKELFGYFSSTIKAIKGFL